MTKSSTKTDSIPEDDCVVPDSSPARAKNFLKKVNVLGDESSKDIIYNHIVGWNMERYRACFEAHPKSCADCKHNFEFEDRLAAGLLLNAHGPDFVMDFLKVGPSQREYLKGIVFCPNCRKFHLLDLMYAYPPNMFVEHSERETEMFAALNEESRG